MATTPTRRDLLFMAKVSEQAEPFEEMVEFRAQIVVVAAADELATDKRIYFNAAYKNAIEPRRASWRIVDAILKTEEIHGNEHHVNALRGYLSKVESEISSICDGVLNLLNSKLLVVAYTTGYKVFYLKMKGDYNRYLAEIKSGPEHKELVEKARSAYEFAQEIAVARGELPLAHPIRLGLALNFSAFYFEILNVPELACNLAQEALDEATPDAVMLGNDFNPDCTLIMQLMCDNLTLRRFHTQINDDEIQFLTKGGDPITDEELLKKLFHPNLNLLIVTEGSGSCKNFKGMVSAMTVKPDVTAGAADAFVGGLLSQLAS